MRRLNALLFCLIAASAGTAQNARPDRPDSSSELQRARLLIDANDFRNALAMLETVEKKTPNDARVVYLHGYVLYRLNRMAEAKQELQRALRADPRELQSSYILARIAESEGKPLEAIRWLKGCAEVTPPVQDARNRIGKLYWETGQTEQAGTWTLKALTDTPWDGSLHYRLGRIYQQSGQPELAKKEFAESVKSKAADSEGVQKLMECSRALARQDTATALEIRREFLNASHLDPDLLVALGTSFASAGAPDQAIDLFRTAAARDPNSFQAQFNMGFALLHLNRAAEAVEPLEKSLRLAPESKDANAALALALVMQDKFEAAVAPLEIARQADPHDRKTAGLLSLAYYRSGQAAKAIPILRESIQESKNDPKYYFLLMDCLNAVERQQDALVVADEAVARFPDIPKAWLGKAQQLARLGKYHEAGPLFAKAAELAPQDKEALLGLAESQQKDGNHERALATYRQVLASTEDLTAALGAARSLIFLGRVAEARTLLEPFEKTNQDNSQLHFELSRVYARLGERDLAAEQTRIVQRLRAENGQGNAPAHVSQ